VIAVATNGNGVLVFDSVSGELKGTIQSQEQIIRAMAVSPDGRIIATAGEGRVIQLSDLMTCQRVGELNGHTDTVRSLAWLPKANRLLSGGKDSSVRVWDPAFGQELCIATTVTGSALDISFSEDERMVAITTEYGVRLLSVDAIGTRLADAAMQSEILTPVMTLLRDWARARLTVPIRNHVVGAATKGTPMDQAFVAAALRAGGWLDRAAISGIGRTGMYKLTKPQPRVDTGIQDAVNKAQ